MPSERKDICDCRILENASKDPRHAIRWDEQTNEYYIAYGPGNRMAVYYCPFCGGSTPKSRRSSLFAHVTDHESFRIFELFKGIRTVADVLARFGPPDQEREISSACRTPARDGDPETGRCSRGLFYKNLSPVADIVFTIGMNDAVRGSWRQKYIGEKKTD